MVSLASAAIGLGSNVIGTVVFNEVNELFNLSNKKEAE